MVTEIKICEMCKSTMTYNKNTDKFFCDKCVYACTPTPTERFKIKDYPNQDNWSTII